ncbi:Branched-chain acyl-CoA synthetase (ADP-forming) beta subunit / acetyl-CoA synthetase (ADP-forming) beta subunit [Desulfurococcus amylolyticus 1221n]|uniref:Branched-chain acyl-CoA synthetase (ADP-forming) beta subunit / acetyl-CoA synthetase (ADP-forming) beta subunit n=1 Tax=Desulfurococcus amylolyticus (strain DSM 18924 / JCM 16383 / VKM B-2413 / 1221n) TaxID=490899 RepID=B8D4M0_DESA1|nr:acetate--CoA ligase family protein [Desulfurococcus amylolyticus]ACL11051.1 Branched-chain acyl-CoA synthetase (ADP-forming) beta subunit / acetyl-CoA synthetase (ADP-forming) beta subunit [Desulfurococcus amylolyticus 1221n]
MPGKQAVSVSSVIGGEGKLSDLKVFHILESYNIPLASYGFASTPGEAVEIAEKIGYPVVVKVVSPDISHKSDVGGVRLGLTSSSEVYRAVEEMNRVIQVKAPGARIEGFLVQKMMPKGVEVIIGSLNDAVFGGVVMFGLGGIFTEVFRDVSFRVAPIDVREALEMIEELRASSIFNGYRGIPPVNKHALADILVKVSRLIIENPWIDSMDLNPVIAYPDKAVVVDARIIVRR